MWTGHHQHFSFLPSNASITLLWWCSLSFSLSSALYSQKGNRWTPRWPLTFRGQHPQNSQMSEFRATAQGLRFRAYPCGARPQLCSAHTTQIPLHTCYSAYRLHIIEAAHWSKEPKTKGCDITGGTMNCYGINWFHGFLYMFIYIVFSHYFIFYRLGKCKANKQR